MLLIITEFSCNIYYFCEWTWKIDSEAIILPEGNKKLLYFVNDQVPSRISLSPVSPGQEMGDYALWIGSTEVLFSHGPEKVLRQAANLLFNNNTLYS